MSDSTAPRLPSPIVLESNAELDGAVDALRALVDDAGAATVGGYLGGHLAFPPSEPGPTRDDGGQAPA